MSPKAITFAPPGADGGLKSHLESASQARVLLLSTSLGTTISAALKGSLELLRGREATDEELWELCGRAPEAVAHGVTPELPAETLAWIEAGDLFEGLLAAAAKGYVFDHVFCLDPWAALIMTAGRRVFPKAKWYFVSDFEDRGRSGASDYWTNTGAWIRALPFDLEIPIAHLAADARRTPSWNRVAPPICAPETRGITSAQKGTEQERLSRRWGATLTRQPETARLPAKALTVFILYGGRLLNLRASLDTLARQECDTAGLSIRVVSSGSSEILSECLRHFSVAHPQIPWDWLDAGPGGNPSISALAPKLFTKPDGRLLVFTDDSTLFPVDFVKRVLGRGASGGHWPVQRITLPGEASAHVLTGNLDPVTHYEKLIAASLIGDPGKRQAALVLDPEVFRPINGERAPQLEGILAGLLGTVDPVRASTPASTAPKDYLLALADAC